MNKNLPNFFSEYEQYTFNRRHSGAYLTVAGDWNSENDE